MTFITNLGTGGLLPGGSVQHGLNAFESAAAADYYGAAAIENPGAFEEGPRFSNLPATIIYDAGYATTDAVEQIAVIVDDIGNGLADVAGSIIGFGEELTSNLLSGLSSGVQFADKFGWVILLGGVLLFAAGFIIVVKVIT